ncbi:GntR family transcriptional regulator [Saccharothrix obliqua]|uniref:GntR family transcriptional regulator n=1 Tax=Saccharothrix obliqua TaxID=2861747 RepID=UPI001C5E14CD|nr:GntR family transcriptional regulator [Saccharothrix obliqua]MBW4716855.1 GntR family transcriptional regulator [Saccharothrix obliqua]
MTKASEVAEALRARIASGELRPAAPLPSEARIGAEYAVSRGTVRDAIARLRQDGLVASHRGRGTFVRHAGARPRHTHARLLATDDDGDWVDVATRGWHAAETATRVGAADAELALDLGVEEHSPVHVHERLLVAPDGRRQARRLHLPAATALAHPALTREPFVTPERLYRVLRADGQEVRCTDLVRVRVPSPADAALAVPDGGLVFVVRRVVRGGDGRALALEETRLSAEDTQLRVEVGRAR